MTVKNNLRQQMRVLLKAISTEAFLHGGEAAAEKLVSSAEWKRYERLLVFLSMENEIDTTPLIEKAFAEKKEVYAPRVFAKRINAPNSKNKTMRFYRISSFEELTRGAFGIREPSDCSESALFKPETTPALIVTPALAFDKKGGRLGRGGGFYDRFFAELPADGDFFLCGFCLEAQIVANVPLDSFDKKVDAVCSEKIFLRKPD
jgi:5-formyltetrahydrofolate cyclo-ligase